MNIYKSSRKLLFAIVLMFIFFFLTPAVKINASKTQTQNLPNLLPLQMLQVDPIFSELHLVPGQDTIFLLDIKNLSDQPVGIHLETSNLIDPQTDQGMLTNMQAQALTTWITIDTPDIILGAQDKKKLTILIHTPQNAQNGGYGATIFMTPFVHTNLRTGTPIVLSKIGSIILGTVGDLNYDNLLKKVFISNFTTPSRILDHSPISFNFSVENTYFTYFTAKPFFTLTPIFGKPQTYLLEEKHIFPGASRAWQTIQVISNNSIFYTADLAVSVGNGNQIHKSLWFIVLPFWVITTLIILALVFLFVAFRKRLILTIKVFIKG